MTDLYKCAKKQLRKIYTLNMIGNLSIAGAAWVALLSARGFSMMEIMTAETVFHIVSIIAEIPSGMFADVFGRKKSLIVSTIFSILSSIFMGFTDIYAGVIASIACSALSWNFCSGTDNALAFDSLKEADAIDEYERFSSIQTIIYRVGSSLSSLCVGLALWMGNRNAQVLSIILAVIRLFIVFTMKENAVILKKKTLGYGERVRNLIKESIGFLKHNPRASKIIFGNGLVGAVDVLLLFSLQDILQDAGVDKVWLGPLLFLTYLGGVFGALAAPKVSSLKFGTLFAVTLTLVIAGSACAFTKIPWIMALGGVVTAFSDDIIQIRADILLNQMVPEDSRATLISVNSLCFSIIMIFLSPLAGWLFT